MALNIKKDFGNTKSRKPDINSLVYGKVPPQAIEAEQAVLGAILLEKDCIDTVMSILPSPECFYTDAHQKVYAAILRLENIGSPIDLVTVTMELKRSEELEIVGGAYFLNGLTMDMVSSAHVEAHARIIMEKYLQREIIRMSGSSIGDAYEDSTDVFDLLNKMDKELVALRQGAVKRDVVRASVVVGDVLAESDELRAKNIEFTGVPTGHDDMDSITRGWQKGQLIILAARPSVGKTAFAINLAVYAAIKSGRKYPTAFFSLEMKNGRIVQRMQAALSAVPYEKILAPVKQTPEDVAAVVSASALISNSPLFFDDTPGLSIVELKAKVRKLKRERGIELVIIDYLQLMSGDSGKSFNREGEVSMISRELKQLAMDSEVPIIALCQLNRAVEARAGKGYKLSDLRESGAIEQDADMVMFLHVPLPEDFKGNETLMKGAGVFIEKHRDGEKRKVAYNFDKTIQRWSPWSPFADTENINGTTFRKVTEAEKKDDLPF